MTEKRPALPFGVVPRSEEYRYHGSRVRVRGFLGLNPDFETTVHRILNRGKVLELVNPFDNNNLGATFRAGATEIAEVLSIKDNQLLNVPPERDDSK